MRNGRKNIAFLQKAREGLKASFSLAEGHLSPVHVCIVLSADLALLPSGPDQFPGPSDRGEARNLILRRLFRIYSCRYKIRD